MEKYNINVTINNIDESKFIEIVEALLNTLKPYNDLKNIISIKKEK